MTGSPQLTIILAFGFLTVARFSLDRSFTSFRLTLVSRATCDED
ncbi:prophage minor tail Z domain protein [Escherichia coli 3-105-05_S3_C1]|nr:prophage minor tail Z domain protein [Escherichia coli 3-105-05_S3_C1]